MKMIKEYVEKYYTAIKNREMSYSELATKILEDIPDLGLTHRTVRYKVSEEFKSLDNKPGINFSQFEVNLDKPLNSSGFALEMGYVEQGCGWVSYDKSPRIKPYLGGNPNNVLVIGDTQFPFHREGYLEHCRAVQERFNCGRVVHIGDVADNHYSSFHETNPDGYGAGEELDRVIAQTREWHRVFPGALVTIGNHDAIINRQAVKAGISSRWIKGLAEVFETPTWIYDTEFIINGTMYTHTLGANTLKAALLRQVNLVVGHEHSQAKIEYAASLDKLFWAMKVGAGVDDRKYAFNYAKTAPAKSIMSCGVVEGNVPFIIPMNL